MPGQQLTCGPCQSLCSSIGVSTGSSLCNSLCRSLGIGWGCRWWRRSDWPVGACGGRGRCCRCSAVRLSSKSNRLSYCRCWGTGRFGLQQTRWSHESRWLWVQGLAQKRQPACYELHVRGLPVQKLRRKHWNVQLIEQQRWQWQQPACCRCSKL